MTEYKVRCTSCNRTQNVQTNGVESAIKACVYCGKKFKIRNQIIGVVKE